MPDLSASLKGVDLGQLKIIAEFWGIEIEESKKLNSIEKDLLAELLNSKRLQELTEGLPEEPQQALSDLVAHQGRIPWSLFTKRYGDVREMGVARRDREKPYLNDSATPSKSLWYRALVGRTFFDTAAGPEEFAYIPQDLLKLLPLTSYPTARQFGRPASKSECVSVIPSNDWIIDDLCTVLAGLRAGTDKRDITDALRALFEHVGISNKEYIDFLIALLEVSGLVDEGKMPFPKATRAFLGAGRGEALREIFSAWKESLIFNELHQLPGIGIEGEWTNDPRLTRKIILDFLSTIPGYPESKTSKDGSAWWSLSSLVDDIKQYQPDFQRPAGDYDSWYIRDVKSGEYFRGFENWEAVDGMLVRYLVAGPLYWLGIVDLASPEKLEPSHLSEVTAFRFTARAADLLEGQAPGGSVEEDEKLVIRSDARLNAPDGVPRPLRYQIARFCRWQAYSKGRYIYRLTPVSLERAKQKGLSVDNLLTLLNRFGIDIPPNLVMALKGWEAHGTQARIERKMILRVGNPEILQKLLGTRAVRFLGDPLGPTAIEIKSGAENNIEAALVELGYLGEIKLESEQ